MTSRAEPRYFGDSVGKASAKVMAILTRIAIFFRLAMILGCSAAAVAAPCWVTGVVVEVVPLISSVLGVPLKACGYAIG
jgi:hypothetical protein